MIKPGLNHQGFKKKGEEMKNIIIVLLIIIPVLVMGQNYGERLPMADDFSDSDSTLLVPDSVRYTTAAADTLYTGLIHLPKIEGSYLIQFFGDSTSGTPTYNVDARLYFSATPTGYHWTVWNDVFTGVHGDSIYTIQFTASQLTFFNQANAIQLRSMQVGAGAATHYLSHFPR